VNMHIFSANMYSLEFMYHWKKNVCQRYKILHILSENVCLCQRYLTAAAARTVVTFNMNLLALL
jgi:hypothetical protein